MSDARATCPATRTQIIDLYFMEHRAKLIDIAAFLDRVDRGNPLDSEDDFRLRALRDAIKLLSDGQADRAKRILEHFSDPTTDPIAKAPGKGADGAYEQAT